MWKEVVGWTCGEMQTYIAHLRNQLRNPNVHTWYKQGVVYGRKPAILTGTGKEGKARSNELWGQATCGPCKTTDTRTGLFGNGSKCIEICEGNVSYSCLRVVVRLVLKTGKTEGPIICICNRNR